MQESKKLILYPTPALLDGDCDEGCDTVLFSIRILVGEKQSSPGRPLQPHGSSTDHKVFFWL